MKGFASKPKIKGHISFFPAEIAFYTVYCRVVSQQSFDYFIISDCTMKTEIKTEDIEQEMDEYCEIGPATLAVKRKRESSDEYREIQQIPAGNFEEKNGSSPGPAPLFTDR